MSPIWKMNNKFLSLEVPNFSIVALRILWSPLNKLLFHKFAKGCASLTILVFFILICKSIQLRHYIFEFLLLVAGDWSQEKMKPSINSITKRLERIFVKVHKRAHVRVSLIAFILLFIGSIQSCSVRMSVIDDSMNTLSVTLLRV